MKFKFLLFFLCLVNSSLLMRSASLTTKPSLYSLKSAAATDFVLRNKYTIGTGLGLLALSGLGGLKLYYQRTQGRLRTLKLINEESSAALLNEESRIRKEIEADAISEKSKMKTVEFDDLARQQELFCALTQAFHKNRKFLHLDELKTYTVPSENSVLMSNLKPLWYRLHPTFSIAGAADIKVVYKRINGSIASGLARELIAYYKSSEEDLTTRFGTCSYPFTEPMSDERLFEGLLYQIINLVLVEKKLDFYDPVAFFPYFDAFVNNKELLVDYSKYSDDYVLGNLTEEKIAILQKIGVWKGEGDTYIGMNKTGKMIAFIREQLPVFMRLKEIKEQSGSIHSHLERRRLGKTR